MARSRSVLKIPLHVARIYHVVQSLFLKCNSNFAEKMRDNFLGNGNQTWLCIFVLWNIEGKRYFLNRIKIKIKAGYFRSIAKDNLSSGRTPTEHRCNISQ